jgi:hypothetical protein
MKMPTQWTYEEGRSPADWKMEAFVGIFRGSRGDLGDVLNYLTFVDIILIK